jgi:hypothetical protein
MHWDVVSEGTGWDEYIHPFVNSDRKPEPSYYPALAAFDIKVDRKSKFPVLLLAIATVCRTIANARLRSELTKGSNTKDHLIGHPTLPDTRAAQALRTFTITTTLIRQFTI